MFGRVESSAMLEDRLFTFLGSCYAARQTSSHACTCNGSYTVLLFLSTKPPAFEGPQVGTAGPPTEHEDAFLISLTGLEGGARTSRRAWGNHPGVYEVQEA